MPSIKLNEGEYETLLRLVYLGNWLVNSVRKNPIRRYQALKRYIFSLAENTSSARLVEYSPELREFVPSPALESDPHIRRFVDKYSETVFWDELSRRLAKRDLENKFGLKLSVMGRKALAASEYTGIDRYNREFVRHGIKRLRAVPALKP